MNEKKHLRPKTMYKTGQNDIFYTPGYGIEPIFRFTPKKWKIWEPCCGSGNIVNYYRDHGFNIIGTDIVNGLDFFTADPPPGTNCIITNPPFSKKNKIIERCIEIGLPFALLMPEEALVTEARSRLWEKCDLKLVIPRTRINFIEGKSIQFHCIWFCVGFEGIKHFEYVDLAKSGKSKNKQLKIEL